MAALTSPWARKAVAVAAVLVAANFALAAVGPSLPDPVLYPTREVQLGVEQLDAQTAGGCVDLLVTGNSIAAHDLSASRLAAELGLRSGVVSVLPGSIAEVDVDWMDRVTLPRARPGTIVYVVSPLTFVPGEVADRYGLGIYTRAVATRGGWAGDLHRWAVDHLPLFEYRLTVSDVEAIVDDAEGDLPTSYAEILAATGRTVEPDGHIRAEGSFAGSDAFLERLADVAQVVSDVWRVDEDQVDALRERFTELTDEGRRVVVVIPPVASSLPPVFPHGVEGYEAYLAAARSLGEGAPFSVVDLSGPGYPDTSFWDTHHLNATGAEQFTAQVGAALAGERFPACDALS
jgi:hypothetical protein